MKACLFTGQVKKKISFGNAFVFTMSIQGGDYTDIKVLSIVNKNA